MQTVTATYKFDKVKTKLAIIAELSKIRITFFVAISGTVGFILAGGSFGIELVMTLLGIFILSCGSSAFNHFQEVDTDSLMIRTKNRPLPANKISKYESAIWASAFVIVGLILLAIYTNPIATMLGVAALFAYNIMYTPLKKITAFAIFPGSIVGALPPAIGWVAAGGTLFDPKLLVLAMFFFIWQIPHFWFLMLIYDNDYRRAGFPTPSKYFSSEQLKRITYVWIGALAASCMMLPFFGVTHNLLTNLLLLIAGGVLLWRTRSLVMKLDKHFNLKLAFVDINVYVLFVVVLISVDKIIN
jgi:protoheme IX farnesyltransferase